MKMRLLFLAGTLAATALPAAAEAPATIRGIVYDCGSHRALAGVPVQLVDVDTHVRVALRSDVNGRFTRVGLQPGRYLIEAFGGVPTSRMARVETDDVLDVLIGTTPGVHMVRETAIDPTPHPRCDPALVPLAPATSDRYILH